MKSTYAQYPQERLADVLRYFILMVVFLIIRLRCRVLAACAPSDRNHEIYAARPRLPSRWVSEDNRT